jgi:hypothetical protein
MKTDTIAPIEGKILVGRGSANKIGMIAGIASNHLDLIETNGFNRGNFGDYIRRDQ